MRFQRGNHYEHPPRGPGRKPYIAELMRHKGLSMTRRYAHLSIANLHEAVARISTDTPIAPEPIHETRADTNLH